MPEALTQAALQLRPRAGYIGALAVLVLAGGIATGAGALALLLQLLGGSLLVITGFIFATGLVSDHTQGRARRQIGTLIEKDSTPSFLTDPDGAITLDNEAAQQRFKQPAETLAARLGDVFLNPQALIFRLGKRAETAGAAREDVVTRRGHVRLSAVSVGAGGLLWRLEEFNQRAGANGGDRAILPTLTVGRRGTVLFMNDTARRLVGSRIKKIQELFLSGALEAGRVNEIQTAEGARAVFVTAVELQAGRRELYLLPAVPGGNVAEDAPALPRVTGSEGDTGDDWQSVEALPVPLLKIGHDGTVLRSNRLARDLLGRETCRNLHLSTLMEGLGRAISDWITEVVEERLTHASEFLRVSRQDREVFVQVTLKRAADAAGAPPALIAVLSDATELKSLEAQFVQSQKMQAIGQLAGGVAHDFNNLLTAISGHCDLLLLRHDQGDPDFNDLTQIYQNANRAAALVGQLLAFSRKQTLRLETVDLRDTLSDLAHLLNRLVGEKVSLNLRHEPKLRMLRADKRQLEQVVMNLVVNARDAMPEGGEILIETRNVTYDAPRDRDRATVPAGHYISVAIRDEGVGIPNDKLQKIFEPFYTTKRLGEGTGLGLSTAYGIVKQSGGFIFCDSTPGEGTVFTVLLPASDASASEAVGEGAAASAAHPDVSVPDAVEAVVESADADEICAGEPARAEIEDVLTDNGSALDRATRDIAALDLSALDASEPESEPEPEARAEPEADDGVKEPASGAEPGPGEPAPAEATGDGAQVTGPQAADARVVLLVEDEAPVRAFASRALRLRGYTVLEAESAEDALDLLDETDLDVDIFVTDVVMPGMDGPSWVRKALETRPGVRVVFVSGYAEEAFREGQAEIPNSVFLPKPFSLSELTDTVRRQLH